MRRHIGQQKPQKTQDCGDLRLTVAQYDTHTVVFSVARYASSWSLRRVVSVLLLVTFLGYVCFRASRAVQAVLAVAAIAGAAWWAVTVTEEVLTVVQGLGVMLSARRRCWWPPASTFVPAERIRHVIINEGVGVSRVTCYLAFMVEGSDRLVVAFQNMLPRLPLLTPVYQQLHARLGGKHGACANAEWSMATDMEYRRPAPECMLS